MTEFILKPNDLVKIIDGETISLQDDITIRLDLPADWGPIVIAVLRRVPKIMTLVLLLGLIAFLSIM